MPKFNPHICRMRWDVEQIYQSNSQQSQQPPPTPEHPHLQEHTAHTWNFYTLCLALLRHSMYISYLRAAFLQEESELIRALQQIFQIFLQSLLQGKLYPLMAISTVETFCRHILQDIIPSAVPLYYPIDRAGLALDCAHKLYRPLHIRMTSYVVTEQYSSLILRIWASFLINDWKGKAFGLVFNQFYP